MKKKTIGLALLSVVAFTSATSALACNLNWPGSGDYCKEQCASSKTAIGRFMCELGHKAPVR